jgi:hypothetical protein
LVTKLLVTEQESDIKTYRKDSPGPEEDQKKSRKLKLIKAFITEGSEIGDKRRPW